MRRIVEYLKNTDDRFDVVICSGILYHMDDPVELLWLLSNKTDRLMIWCHYFHEQDESRNKISSFKGVRQHEFNGAKYNYHRQEYGVGFETNVYCGGTARHSNWMSREGILQALKNFAFSQVKVFDDDDSINGAYLLLAATK